MSLERDFLAGKTELVHTRLNGKRQGMIADIGWNLLVGRRCGVISPTSEDALTTAMRAIAWCIETRRLRASA